MDECATGWVALNRANERRRTRAMRSLEIEFDFVDVAPAPVFAGLDGFHDGVVGSVEMLCGVFVLGGIAAGDVAADHAEAKVNPGVAHFDALGADVGVGFDAFLDLI
jgi:hypothetical protein